MWSLISPFFHMTGLRNPRAIVILDLRWGHEASDRHHSAGAVGAP